MIILSFCFPRSEGGFLVEEPWSVWAATHQKLYKAD